MPLGDTSDTDIARVNSALPYSDYGYLPNAAQAAMAAPYVAPELFSQPYFSKAQLAVAQWFTTRVHLSPLGGNYHDPEY